MMMWRIVKSEQHTLLAQQRELFDSKLGAGNWIEFPVPASGWTLADIQRIAAAWPRGVGAVMASPVMALALMLRRGGHRRRVWALHNDRREAVETKQPDGTRRIVHRVASEGWKLV